MFLDKTHYIQINSQFMDLPRDKWNARSGITGKALDWSSQGTLSTALWLFVQCLSILFHNFERQKYVLF